MTKRNASKSFLEFVFDVPSYTNNSVLARSGFYTASFSCKGLEDDRPCFFALVGVLSWSHQIKTEKCMKRFFKKIHISDRIPCIVGFSFQLDYNAPPCSTRRRNSYDSTYYTDTLNGKYLSEKVIRYSRKRPLNLVHAHVCALCNLELTRQYQCAYLSGEIGLVCYCMRRDSSFLCNYPSRFNS